MNDELQQLLGLTTELSSIVESAQISGNSFDQQYGWNQIHIQRADLVTYITNLCEKIEQCINLKINSDEINLITHISNIQRLNNMVRSYFNNNPNHLISVVPIIILTLSTVDQHLNSSILTWDAIEDNKLLPRSISSRLRGLKTQLDNYDESFSNLDSKITTINEAHEAAESLPTDLASLKEAKQALSGYLKSAQKDIDKTKSEIELIKNKINNFENQAKNACDSSKKEFDDLVKITNDANLLVQQCDDALQITTTQGLAAGFDQKAKELRNSLRVWISGLIIALCSGAYIGEQRVEAFTKALETNLTPGQALLHTIISIFSIGGPLWLAWISTQQINQRFKLSEDYSYKATVAKSFTGFKKLADRFDDETAQRLFNSTLDRFDEMPLRLVEGKDYNSPWHEFIDSEAFKKALDMVPALAHEAGRFVNQTKLKKKPKADVKKQSNTQEQEQSNSSE